MGLKRGIRRSDRVGRWREVRQIWRKYRESTEEVWRGRLSMVVTTVKYGDGGGGEGYVR